MLYITVIKAPWEKLAAEFAVEFFLFLIKSEA